MEVSDARKLKAPEDENAKLKKLLAEAMLNVAILKDVASKKVTSDVKRDAVAHIYQANDVSQLRTCSTTTTDHTLHWAISRPANSP
uniref:hypothetical protein n=1 Tax=Brucella sp. 2716 TaxID=2975052 RepID=UPI0038F71DA4